MVVNPASYSGYTKYLIARDGKQVQSFASAVEPMGRELTAAVEAALQR